MGYPTYLRVLSAELLDQIESEVERARAKFPDANHLNIALMEETGELAQAQLQHGPRSEEAKGEAVQVIAVAIRIIQEGDRDLDRLSLEDMKP